MAAHSLNSHISHGGTVVHISLDHVAIGRRDTAMGGILLILNVCLIVSEFF